MTPLRPRFSCIVPTIVLLSGCFPGLPVAEETTGATTAAADPATTAVDPTTTDGPTGETTDSPAVDATDGPAPETSGGPNTETTDGTTSESPTPSFCGDGVLDGGEECDLGVDQNGIGGAACRETCELNVCGDGYIAGDEACDDANKTANDGCSPDCALEECGDGVTQTGEGCDDGNASNSDECLNTCELPVCGDGFVQVDVEECDDANDIDTDSCVACMDAFCGDGHVGPGEACDDGNKVDNDACSNVCASADCGDNVVQPPEECDDGNAIQTDACLNSCKQAKCGDGVVQDGVEQCDDGNTNDKDACTNMCKTAKCGDGIVQDGVDQCDDGDLDNDDECSNSCKLRCGNKVIDSGEACDDGNADNWFCDSTCKRSGLVVFVTSQKYGGNLKGSAETGLEGADAKCNSVATSAGLIGAGTYVAWLSTQSETAIKKIQPGMLWKNLPYRLLDGTKVSDDFGYSLHGAPINVTQTGQKLVDGGEDCAAATNVVVWTSTTDNLGYSLENCNGWMWSNWPPNEQMGDQGRADKYLMGDWTEACSALCETTARLYCIETPK